MPETVPEVHSDSPEKPEKEIADIPPHADLIAKMKRVGFNIITEIGSLNNIDHLPNDQRLMNYKRKKEDLSN